MGFCIYIVSITMIIITIYGR